MDNIDTVKDLIEILNKIDPGKKIRAFSDIKLICKIKVFDNQKTSKGENIAVITRIDL